MNKTSYPIIIEEDAESGWYVVTNPAIEGCYSQGKTIDEALENIKEATQLCLDSSDGVPHIKNVSLHLVTL